MSRRESFKWKWALDAHPPRTRVLKGNMSTEGIYVGIMRIERVSRQETAARMARVKTLAAGRGASRPAAKGIAADLYKMMASDLP